MKQRKKFDAFATYGTVEEIAGNGGYKVPVVGTRHKQPELLALCGGKRTKNGRRRRCQAFLIVDAKSPIYVEIKGQRFGELPDEISTIIRDVLPKKKQAYRVNAMIVGGWDDGESLGSFGIRLDIK